MNPKTRVIVGAIALVAACSLPSLAAGVKTDARGFIYGTIETESGNEYTGTLRWGTEETFWDDLFHGSKDDLPYLKQLAKERRRRVTVLGVPIGYRWEGASGRLLVARYGDIKEILVRRGDRAELLMKSGNVHVVDGGSNDVGGKITVFDRSLGKVVLPWDRIERIVFAPTPRDIEVDAYRLYGTLHTEDTTFEGYIQWDKQECLSTDKLDGESSDGDLSIEMGKIRRIERRNSSSSRVTLKDGRELTMRGTNDVDSDNRGIYVEDERYGRVEVSWDVFEFVEFKENGKSGRGYDDYDPARPLRGKVTDYDDDVYSGAMVFDLDESETWEMLHGTRNGVEYNIPFDLIRSVSPDRRDTSRVVLTNDIELLLEDGQDVSERNAGMVVLREGTEREAYIDWRDVKQIDFE